MEPEQEKHGIKTKRAQNHIPNARPLQRRVYCSQNISFSVDSGSTVPKSPPQVRPCVFHCREVASFLGGTIVPLFFCAEMHNFVRTRKSKTGGPISFVKPTGTVVRKHLSTIKIAQCLKCHLCGCLAWHIDIAFTFLSIEENQRQLRLQPTPKIFNAAERLRVSNAMLFLFQSSLNVACHKYCH